MRPNEKVRVFVVEDEAIILLELTLTLGDLGYEVVGSASDLDTGLALAHELALDVGVLDINLANRNSGPIADVLADRGVPFVFVSGYTKSMLAPRHAASPVLAKPYSPEALRSALQDALSRAAHFS